MKASAVISHLTNPQKSGSVITFFKGIGFTHTHIEKLVATDPNILSVNLDSTVRPKIKVFRDLGFSAVDMADIISRDPSVLLHFSSDRIRPSIVALKSVLGSKEEVCKLLKKDVFFLRGDLKKTMLPNIEYLKSMGINSAEILKAVYRKTRFLLSKPETLHQAFVSVVGEMGFDKTKSSMLLHAIMVRSSLSEETWRSKLKLFKSLGMSESEISALFRRMPPVFAVSAKKIKEVTELLVSSGKCDISYLAKNPLLFMFCVERRLKPRLQVIQVLDENKVLKEMPSLVTIFSISAIQFQDMFVSPYSHMLSEDLNRILGRTRTSKSD